MQGQFNKASLARMTKSELLIVKANLRAKFDTASSPQEKASIQNQINRVETALNQNL